MLQYYCINYINFLSKGNKQEMPIIISIYINMYIYNKCIYKTVKSENVNTVPSFRAE